MGGLTDFGRALIDRMNALGMLVDLSHANMTTMADSIAHSRMPVIISHTGCDAVHPHVRNTTDANPPSVGGAESRGGGRPTQAVPHLQEAGQPALTRNESGYDYTFRAPRTAASAPALVTSAILSASS